MGLCRVEWPTIVWADTRPRRSAYQPPFRYRVSPLDQASCFVRDVVTTRRQSVVETFVFDTEVVAFECQYGVGVVAVSGSASDVGGCLLREVLLAVFGEETHARTCHTQHSHASNHKGPDASLHHMPAFSLFARQRT